MKKLSIIAAALAATVACTQSTIYEDNLTAISFQPVAGQITKAYYGPMNNTDGYQTTESFKVFAYHKLADSDQEWSAFYGTDGSGISTYINDKTYSHKSGNNWSGGDYWPKTGSLMFAGYSPAEASKTGVTYKLGTIPVLEITGFQQGDYSQMVDLMWFNANDDDSKSVNNSASPTTAVPVVFHHALAWLTFNFTSDIAGLFYLTSATLDNVNTSGDFSGSYNTVLTASWTNQGNPQSYTLYTNDPGEELSSTAKKADNLLVIPYNFTSATDGNYQLTLKYRQGGTGQLEQTHNIQLKSLTTKTWEAGKHYTYNITFTADEILIAPSVDKWTAGDTNDVTIQ